MSNKWKQNNGRVTDGNCRKSVSEQFLVDEYRRIMAENKELKRCLESSTEFGKKMANVSVGLLKQLDEYKAIIGKLDLFVIGDTATVYMTTFKAGEQGYGILRKACLGEEEK